MDLLKSFSFNMPIFEKYFFYTFTAYLVLRGMCAITWATIVYLYEVRYLDAWTKGVAISLETLIAIGGVLIIFAICSGGYGILFFDSAKFRNRCTHISRTTVTFTSLFLIMLIVQSAVAIYMLVLVPRAATDFKEAFKNYGYRCEDTKFVDDIQDRSYCCGIYSYHDYQEILDILIPGSCCNNSWGVCTAEDVGFRPGCAFRLNTSRLIHQVYLMSIFILTVTVTVLVGFLFALYLTNSIKERNVVKRHETYTLLHGNNANKIFPASS